MMRDNPNEAELVMEDGDDDDEAVAVTYDIASYPSDFTLSGIVQMWDEGGIIIPDYQREFIWSMQQSSLLIDSFLRGLPVPAVFFYVGKDYKKIVIDGQQRILSIIFFFKGYFGTENPRGKHREFRLSGLPKTDAHHNLTYQDLPETERRKLNNSVLRAMNIQQLNPAGESTSAYHIFERLNTGGTPLTPQEIRNCVYRGEFNDLLKDANNDTNWRKILGSPYPDKHQKDVEVLLRVFSLLGGSQYEKPMKEFLNKTMREHCLGRTKKAKNFFNLFKKVTASVVKEIGEKPFHIRGPLNASALDSVMCVLIDNHTKLDSIDINQKYKELKKDKLFDEYTRWKTTDTRTLTYRINKVKEIMLG